MKQLLTKWGADIDRECPHNDYPRPQLRRAECQRRKENAEKRRIKNAGFERMDDVEN